MYAQIEKPKKSKSTAAGDVVRKKRTTEKPSDGFVGNAGNHVAQTKMQHRKKTCVQLLIDPVRIQQLTDIQPFMAALRRHVENNEGFEPWPQRVLLARLNVRGFHSEIVMFNWVCRRGDRNGVPRHLWGAGLVGGQPSKREAR